MEKSLSQHFVGSCDFIYLFFVCLLMPAGCVPTILFLDITLSLDRNTKLNTVQSLLDETQTRPTESYNIFNAKCLLVVVTVCRQIY